MRLWERKPRRQRSLQCKPVSSEDSEEDEPAPHVFALSCLRLHLSVILLPRLYPNSLGAPKRWCAPHRKFTGLLKVAMKLHTRTTHRLGGFRRRRKQRLWLWKDGGGNFHDDLLRREHYDIPPNQGAAGIGTRMIRYYSSRGQGMAQGLCRSKRLCGVIYYGVGGWSGGRGFKRSKPTFSCVPSPSCSPSLASSPSPTYPIRTVGLLGKQWPTRTPPTQRAPRHVSQLPAEARPQRQSVNSFGLRLPHTWRLVRQSLAANLAVSAAWYNMRGSHALRLLITDFYAAFMSGTFLSICVTMNLEIHWGTLSCRRLRTLFITWTLLTRRTKKEKRTPRWPQPVVIRPMRFSISYVGRELVIPGPIAESEVYISSARWSILIGGASLRLAAAAVHPTGQSEWSFKPGSCSREGPSLS
ncbi:hypothetical protein EDB89DRAFT_1333884 [Lactarius sanguifluus]|nr:hypothetical protein EDB89DRAFT_1333884 [Lactarius sanguifluus]